MIERIVTSTLDRWPELWPDAARPQRLTFLLQSRRRIVVFLFDPERRGHLVAVAKISRRVEDNPRLEKTVELQKQARQRLSENLGQTVPRALILEDEGPLRVSVEQGLPGDPMYLGGYGRRTVGRHRRNWNAWREWLIAFQESTSLGWSKVGAETLDEVVLPRIEQALQGDHGGAAIAGDLSSLTHQLREQEIERVWRYGDAHHSNILTRGGTVSGVVDWEGTQPDQWPVMDWFQFALQYLMDVHRMRRPSASRQELATLAVGSLLDEPQAPIDAVAATESQLFMQHWGIQPSAVTALFVAFLAQFHWSGDTGALLRHVHAVLRL